MLERSTGDSRNEVGLSPGGIVIHGDLEIGSFAGDISLYLAPRAAAALELWRNPAWFGSFSLDSSESRNCRSEAERFSPELSAVSIVGLERVRYNQSRREFRKGMKGVMVIRGRSLWGVFSVLLKLRCEGERNEKGRRGRQLTCNVGSHLSTVIPFSLGLVISILNVLSATHPTNFSKSF